MKTNSKVSKVLAFYEAPMIEVIDIKLEQNILQTGSGPTTPGEVW
ncbi:MAG: hypothetical protein PHO13_04360 [Fermentimonas sp.]|jgi:hypothetical protein|nr:hypothetical protein [Fermentimonas sp.]MDD2930802.1 hypothetical protein [Fermentimonas sp.]MDD3188716.1 hypothetical protein [Fermentimonas sp.]MDD3510945.1 hypothetical protein [Fermentimonas sp.]MDD4283865.1 hypothetical protein [Fermentimonas sp.]